MEAKKLLKTLFALHSPSDCEDDMREFILNWVKSNIQGAVCEWDATGNVYVTKGTADAYPCIVAHMDQVQDIHSEDFMVIDNNEIMFGYSPSNKQMEGLGADDKVGIWVALCCLKTEPNLKCAFFVGEEVGCVGSNDCDMDFFSDCMYVIQCDRKGRNDFISDAGCTELCSKEFIQDIGLELFGYREEHGLMTDVMTLKDRGLKVSACNISCGYYDPHTSHEFIVIKDVTCCLAFVRNILKRCTRTYPHESQSYGYAGYGRSWTYGRYGRGYYGGFSKHKQSKTQKGQRKNEQSAQNQKEREDTMRTIRADIDNLVCTRPSMSDDDICYEILAAYSALDGLTSGDVYKMISESRALNYMDYDYDYDD